jgi:mannosyltransferase OCH1-like enzyme
MSNFPKIIHFIWVNFKNELDQNPIIPQKYLDNLKNVKKINSNYKIKIWNGYDCNKFVRKYFPDKINIYWKLPYPIQRCDYIRFLILYIYGGIYSDMDRYSIKSYDTILEKYSYYDIILTQLSSSLNIINNDIIISKPKNSFILKCIDNIKIYNFNNYYFDVCTSTGPIYLIKMYYQYNELSKIKLISNELNPCLCSSNIDDIHKIISYTTLDGSWLENNNFTNVLKYIYCNFVYILFIIIIIFLLYKLYKK